MKCHWEEFGIDAWNRFAEQERRYRVPWTKWSI